MSARPWIGTLLGACAALGWWWSLDAGPNSEVRAATVDRNSEAALTPRVEDLLEEARPQAQWRESVQEPPVGAPPAEVPAPKAMELQTARSGEQSEETNGQLAAWLADLRSDDVAWNATDAASRLTHAIRRRANRERLRPLAEPLLYSDDRQQRLLVTTLMLRLENQSRKASDGRVPHPVLEERALEWLARPEDLGFYCGRLTPNSGSARRFCLNQGFVMHGQLAGKLDATDEEVRYYAALLLGAQGAGQYASRVARVLVPHLADNKVEEDALEAAYALKKLGPAVLRWLPASSVDKQQAYFLEALRAEIRQPGSSATSEGRWDLSFTAPYGPVSDYSPKAY